MILDHLVQSLGFFYMRTIVICCKFGYYIYEICFNINGDLSALVFVWYFSRFFYIYMIEIFVMSYIML